MLDLSKPVHWLDGNRHRVGRVAIVRYSQTLTCHVRKESVPYGDKILVRHAHTGELEFVPVSKLSQYPSEPIPEPKESGK